jgi:DNA-directed RNA polymerase specialized sigma24 family protein
MKAIIEKVMAKQARFEEFVAQTLPYWRCVAGDLLNRADAPPSVDIDDVVQELLTEAWRGIQRADADKGNVRSYVVSGAVRAAKRWLNRQRGAKHNDVRSPSRCPVVVEWIESVPEQRDAAAQEQAAELLASMRLARSKYDRMVLEAFIATPSVDLVANQLYADPLHRRWLRFSSAAAARLSVRKTLCRLAKRAGNAGHARRGERNG